MFKKKQSLSERFSLACGRSGEESTSQSNKDLIAKLRGRTEKWSSANSLHSDLLDKKIDDSKCVSADKSKGKLNITLKVNQNLKNGSSDFPTSCDEENFHRRLHRNEANSVELSNERGTERKHSDNVPKLSVLERGYCDTVLEPTYEPKKFRRYKNNTQLHEQKNKWPANSRPYVKELNRNHSSNGHFEKRNGDKSKYKETEAFRKNVFENRTAGKQKAGFNLPYCGFIECDAFQDEMDDVYQSSNQSHKNAREKGHTDFSEVLVNKSLKITPNETRLSFNSSPASAAVCVNNSKSPVLYQQQGFLSNDKRTRPAGSPRTFKYKGFFSEVIDSDGNMQGSDSNNMKNGKGSAEKSEKDILVDSLLKHCQALVTNEQDKQALNQVRKILEIETGHEVNIENSGSEADTSTKGSNISHLKVINHENKEKSNFKKYPEIPARFSPSISSTSSPDNNKINLLKFEGRTLLKGGVKPRHIPKSTIEKPGLDPPLDPRLKEKYGKSSCYLALPKWHRDFVLEQKDKMLKSINRSVSRDVLNNNHFEENDRNFDSVDMDLDDDKNDLVEEYNPDHFEPDPFIPVSNEDKIQEDQNMMKSCSTAAEMEQSIMHFLKKVQSNEGNKVLPKEPEVDKMEDEKVDDKLIKLLKDTRTEIETSIDFCGEDGASKVSNAKKNKDKSCIYEQKVMNHKNSSSATARKERDRSADFDKRHRRTPPFSKNGVERYRRRSRSRSGRRSRSRSRSHSRSDSISRSYSDRHSRSGHDKRCQREITSHHSRYRSRSRSRSGSNSQHKQSEYLTMEEKITQSKTCKQLKTETFMPQSYRRDDAYKRDLSPLYCN